MGWWGPFAQYGFSDLVLYSQYARVLEILVSGHRDGIFGSEMLCVSIFVIKGLVDCRSDLC